MFVVDTGYDRLVNKYEKHIRRNIKNYEEILAKAAGKLSKQHYILDFGAGTGDLAIMLCKKNKNAKITAIDASRKMLELAEKKIHVAGLQKRIRLVHDNKIAGRQKFDAIVSTFMFYLTDRQKIAKEFNRHLKRNGLLVLTDICHSNRLEKISAGITNLAQLLGGTPVANFCSVGELRKTLYSAGFRKIRISAVGKLLWQRVYLITATKI